MTPAASAASFGTLAPILASMNEGLHSHSQGKRSKKKK
jgi:hypothetical protein